MDFMRAGVSTEHQAPPLKYFYGSVLAQKRRSNAFESVVIFVADEFSLAGDVDAACFGAPHYPSGSDKFRNSASR